MMRPSLPWIRRCPLMWPEFLGRFALIDNDIHQDTRFCYLLLKLLIKNKAAFSLEFYRKCNEINQNGARRKKNQFCGTKDSPKALYKEKQAVSLKIWAPLNAWFFSTKIFCRASNWVPTLSWGESSLNLGKFVDHLLETLQQQLRLMPKANGVHVRLVLLFIDHSPIGSAG